MTEKNLEGQIVRMNGQIQKLQKELQEALDKGLASDNGQNEEGVSHATVFFETATAWRSEI